MAQGVLPPALGRGGTVPCPESRPGDHNGRGRARRRWAGRTAVDTAGTICANTAAVDDVAGFTATPANGDSVGTLAAVA